MRITLGIFLLVFTLHSCDKNKELIKYTEYYRVVDGDTISSVYIPSAFTPDGDGINDYFSIWTDGFYYDSTELFIYNSYGEIVFYSQRPNGTVWDGDYHGMRGSGDTYQWKFIGKDTTNYKQELTGSVFVLY